MQLKKVTSKNKQDFHTTYINALREGFLDFVPNKMIDNFDKNFETYFNDCKNKNVEMWICYDGDLPVGVIVFGKAQMDNAGEDDAEIDSIYFRKFAHGKGYAGSTLKFAEETLKKAGFKTILLWCSKENTRAWRFYTKNGYKPTEQIWNDNLDGKIFHNILFAKNI